MILALCIAICILTPVLAFFAFIAGFKSAKSILVRGDVSISQMIREAKGRPLTAEERRQQSIRQNIENFGTEIPQKEVK